MLRRTKNIFLVIIDFFHQPFERWISVQNFRYLACGGSNMVLDTAIYFVAYNYILLKQPIVTPFITISPHIAAFMMSFCISFPLGFMLSKYIVFTESNLKGRVQLFRYALLVGMCIILNYLFLKLFVEVCGFYPTPSKMLTTLFVAVFSYVSQRHFTFRVKTEVISTSQENG